MRMTMTMTMMMMMMMMMMMVMTMGRGRRRRRGTRGTVSSKRQDPAPQDGWEISLAKDPTICSCE
eukprot:9173759-Pyramimonas_sp.AAC.1